MGILQMTHFWDVRITQNHWLTEVKLTQEIQALRAYYELLPFRFRCVTPDHIKALEGGDVYADS